MSRKVITNAACFTLVIIAGAIIGSAAGLTLNLIQALLGFPPDWMAIARGAAFGSILIPCVAAIAAFLFAIDL